MDFSVIKLVHVSTVTLSGIGFLLRAIGSVADAAWVRSRLARTLPHINDTVLLLSALVMLWMLKLNPLQHAWLVAKIMALLVYIALGIVALNTRHPKSHRLISAITALIVYSYIVSVALTRNIGGWPAVLRGG